MKISSTPGDSRTSRGPAAEIARALGHAARARGMTQVARDSGLTRETRYKAPSDRGDPSFATILKDARYRGVRLHAKSALRENRGQAANDHFTEPHRPIAQQKAKMAGDLVRDDLARWRRLYRSHTV